MHKAMWWAQQSGMFAHHQQQEFHELLRMLQVAAVRCARARVALSADAASRARQSRRKTWWATGRSTRAPSAASKVRHACRARAARRPPELRAAPTSQPAWSRQVSCLLMHPNRASLTCARHCAAAFYHGSRVAIKYVKPGTGGMGGGNQCAADAPPACANGRVPSCNKAASDLDAACPLLLPQNALPCHPLPPPPAPRSSSDVSLAQAGARNRTGRSARASSTFLQLRARGRAVQNSMWMLERSFGVRLGNPALFASSAQCPCEGVSHLCAPARAHPHTHHTRFLNMGRR